MSIYVDFAKKNIWRCKMGCFHSVNRLHHQIRVEENITEAKEEQVTKKVECIGPKYHAKLNLRVTIPESCI